MARQGETALSVADDYGVPVQKLRQWNHLRGNQLRVGQTLRIYKPLAGSEARQTASSASRAKTNATHSALAGAKKSGSRNAHG